ncbi:hypothetical protein QVD17_20860 [Tagetes erecta]|uniref:FBD domain-containing protein n=1 Tax=Tagetes erecta TaxID=13708 RepID=A0AAD8NXL6_TARER|nr:hypothetical protein QVD17_20860 [Tagetes erecta]
MSARSFSTVFELVGSFPKLQELDLSFAGCKLTEGGVIERCPATFPSLTTLKLSNIYLGNEMKLSYVMEVLRCFPNLQTLEIRTIRSKPVSTPRRCFPEADYNTMGLLQLQNAEFEVFTGSDYEVCLIKYILARSPFLKKIAIRLEYKNVERLFARKLLKLHRASPVAEIDLC